MEGEPASAKDRVLLTSAPHLVLDGAEVAAAVVGRLRDRGLRGRRQRTGGRVARGRRRRAAAGRRGPGVRITVLRPPGRYVTGEESALVAWLERAAGPPDASGRQVGAAPGGPPPGHGAQRRDPVPGGPHRPPRPGRGSADWARPRPRARPWSRVSGAVRFPGVLEVELGTPVVDILERAGLQTGAGRSCWSAGTAGRGWTRPGWPPPSPPAPWPRWAPPRGWASSSPCRVGVVRHRRDGPDRPVHGRRERRAVRPVRVRPAGHRRGPRAAVGRSGRSMRWSSGSSTARPRSTVGGRAGTPTAWSGWCGARWRCSPTTPGPTPRDGRAPGTPARRC